MPWETTFAFQTFRRFRRPRVVKVSDMVTVVIPCLNEAEALPVVLDGIPPGYRILVVDNNSTDDTARVARSMGR